MIGRTLTDCRLGLRLIVINNNNIIIFFVIKKSQLKQLQ